MDAGRQFLVQTLTDHLLQVLGFRVISARKLTFRFLPGKVVGPLNKCVGISAADFCMLRMDPLVASVISDRRLKGVPIFEVKNE